jgi:phenylpyruvate tautomerase PptA (4-oxalocrotonate tautomerase family)
MGLSRIDMTCSDIEEIVGLRSPDNPDRNSAQPIRRDEKCHYGKCIIRSRAFTVEDKKKLAKQVTGGVCEHPIPKFYVVFIFEEVAKDSCFVGGEPHNKFVRFKIDQIARTLPGPVIREWWTRTLDKVIAPFVKDRWYV